MKDFLHSVRFKILIALLIILAGFMVTAVYTGGAAHVVSQVTGFITVPLQRGAASLSNSVSSFFEKYINTGAVYERNLELQTEVNDLRRKLVDYERAIRENDQFRDILGVQENRQDLTVEPAAVIARDPSERFYSFTIDKGSLHNISYLDPVMTSDGLVGYVAEVGMNYSKVITILDVTVDVGAYSSATRDIGIVSGTIELAADGLCQMEYLPRESTIAEGNLVLTSGGNLYPRDIIIGKVLRVEANSHGTGLVAIIQPAANIETLRDVVVITHFDGQGEQ